MKERNALLAIHLGALLFGLSGIFGKLAATTPNMIAGGRALFAILALGLTAVLWRNRNALRPNLRQVALLAIGGLLLGAHWVTFFEAVKVAGVAIATLGFASFPAFTVLLEGLLFRERTRPMEFAMVGVVCLGLVLVTPEFSLASTATGGLLWAVLSGFLFALLSLLNRASTRGLDPVQAALYQNLTVFVCFMPLAWPLLPSVRPMDWLWLAMLGIFCTGLAHSLFVASLRVLKARTTAVIFALEPVYGILFAWWLFSEQPTLRMLAGGVLIVGAIFVSARMAR
ncbi:MULTISPECIES: DMT family transporter [Pseudomonadaceae]|jgi:drug/metabolite transporter (DMT)-like permease|uniref:EamA domain-containing protein n=2 Tax=Ectopseudomonas TaxID=3236654 RepID=A4XTB6_ECTM1|nr:MULTISPECIES: DMT family transporter [Pseudomonas]MBF8161355.1 DMT family transporter [Pseudomonas mendocina]MDH0098724.1 DMT family transporter [Pseudomonas sp. GD04158]USR41489.1 DMT family transporter [Pseudomonas hydrolytica]UTH29915.1 DMT family transporter [Pseudomonas hydrolytica]UTH38238.1 DMT family transporter [Pseudomonas sp. KHPS1]